MSDHSRAPSRRVQPDPSTVRAKRDPRHAETLNLLHRRAARQRDRRFSGEPPTGFGSL